MHSSIAEPVPVHIPMEEDESVASIRGQLEDFVSRSDQVEMSFPTTLTSGERKTVHEVRTSGRGLGWSLHVRHHMTTSCASHDCHMKWVLPCITWFHLVHHSAASLCLMSCPVITFANCSSARGWGSPM